MDADKKIVDAYKLSKNVYDDVLTKNKWWSKLYIHFFWGGVDDLMIAHHVLNMIPHDFAGTLLDVPVGTAVFTAEKYDLLPNAEITCLDYSSDMLMKARERFSKKNICNVMCKQGDVGELPFEEESFDIVLSMNGFHAFPDKNAAFKEIARVLKKDGLFCGCFYIKNESRRTDFIVNQVLAKKGWFTPPFFTMAQLREKLAQDYSKVDIKHDKAMVYFQCIK